MAYLGLLHLLVWFALTQGIFGSRPLCRMPGGTSLQYAASAAGDAAIAHTGGIAMAQPPAHVAAAAGGADSAVLQQGAASAQ